MALSLKITTVVSYVDRAMSCNFPDDPTDERIFKKVKSFTKQQRNGLQLKCKKHGKSRITLYKVSAQNPVPDYKGETVPLSRGRYDV